MFKITFNHFLTVFALFGICAGVLIQVVSILHLTTFVNSGTVWLLGVGLFVVCTPMVLSEIFADSSPSLKSRPWERFVKSLPQWTHYVGSAFFVYAIVSVALVAASPTDGVAIANKKGYFLHDNGISRRISRSQYKHYVARNAALFASFTNTIYFIGFCYFGLYTKKNEINQ